MHGESKSLVWGILLIFIGILFLGDNLGWFYLDWENLWPLLMICGGILFWIGWFRKRSEVGLLMPGTILIIYGALFEYCAIFDWYYMEYLWPVFLLGPGVGFLAMYLLGNKEKGLLIPASILIILAFLFFMGTDVFSLLWPILLIAVGLYLLLQAKKKDKTEEIVESKES